MDPYLTSNQMVGGSSPSGGTRVRVWLRLETMPYKDAAKQREYQRLYVARRRAEFFTDKHCAECGGTKMLEIDHVDASEKVSHKVWSWSASRRQAEQAKCQVLCADCHQDKTNRAGETGRGEKNRTTKLTEMDIRAIRSSSESVAEIMKRFGIGNAQVYRIRSRKQWRHVED